MGKVPIRLKEVVYTLSPFEQNVMGGLWKDMPHKASHYFNTVGVMFKIQISLSACSSYPVSKSIERALCRPKTLSSFASCR